MLLLKDSSERPLVSQLLLTPYIKQKMEEFIVNRGSIGDQNLHVRKVKSKKIDDNTTQDLTSPSLISEDEEAKTMIRKSVSEKERKMKENTAMAISNYSTAKLRKMRHLYGSDFKFEEEPTEQRNKSQNFSNGFGDIGGAKDKHSMTAYPSKVPNDPKKVMVQNIKGGI